MKTINVPIKEQVSEQSQQLFEAISKKIGKLPNNIHATIGYSTGYNEAALIDLIGIIIVRNFTNYTYLLTGIPIDFRQAPVL